MYFLIAAAAILVCVYWLYTGSNLAPVVSLLTIILTMFKDDIQIAWGWRVRSFSLKSRLLKGFKFKKYSFTSQEYINPRIIEDLVGWISDNGNQIAAINIIDSNESNRYYAEISIDDGTGKFPTVRASNGKEVFTYQYIGQSFTGTHLLLTTNSGGGSGVFCNIVLVTISLDKLMDFSGENMEKNERVLIKLAGIIPLGDRYDGKIEYSFGVLRIPACKNFGSIRKKNKWLIVL